MVVLVLINWCDKNLMIFFWGGGLLIEVADEENVIQNLCSIKKCTRKITYTPFNDPSN